MLSFLSLILLYSIDGFAQENLNCSSQICDEYPDASGDCFFDEFEEDYYE